MKANLFYIVQALVHVKVGLGIAPVQIESLERGPWSELRGQVPANSVQGKTEDASDASKNMHLHLRSALLHSPDNRPDSGPESRNATAQGLLTGGGFLTTDRPCALGDLWGFSGQTALELYGERE
jgi:hypothetical protein